MNPSPHPLPPQVPNPFQPMSVAMGRRLSGPPTNYPRRFSWPMRFFLGIMLIHLVFRTMMILPSEALDRWFAELGVDWYPAHYCLPTYQRLVEGVPEDWEKDQPLTRIERVMRVLDYSWEFHKPWPDHLVRQRIKDWPDIGKFYICWLYSRTSFHGRLLGFSQSWSMFSPGPRTEYQTCRIRLIYEDGSEFIVRQLADPEDPTNFSHWFQEKVLDYEAKAKSYASYNFLLGYCNLLANRYGQQNGSPLKTIRLRMAIYYPYPTMRLFPFSGTYQPMPSNTGTAMEWWSKQKGPPEDQLSKEFFEYDVKEKSGKWLVQKIWN